MIIHESRGAHLSQPASHFTVRGCPHKLSWGRRREMRVRGWVSLLLFPMLAAEAVQTRARPRCRGSPGRRRPSSWGSSSSSWLDWSSSAGWSEDEPSRSEIGRAFSLDVQAKNTWGAELRARPPKPLLHFSDSVLAAAAAGLLRSLRLLRSLLLLEHPAHLLPLKGSEYQPKAADDNTARPPRQGASAGNLLTAGSDGGRRCLPQRGLLGLAGKRRAR